MFISTYFSNVMGRLILAANVCNAKKKRMRRFNFIQLGLPIFLGCMAPYAYSNDLKMLTAVEKDIHDHLNFCGDGIQNKKDVFHTAKDYSPKYIKVVDTTKKNKNKKGESIAIAIWHEESPTVLYLDLMCVNTLNRRQGVGFQILNEIASNILKIDTEKSVKGSIKLTSSNYRPTVDFYNKIVGDCSEYQGKVSSASFDRAYTYTLAVTEKAESDNTDTRRGQINYRPKIWTKRNSTKYRVTYDGCYKQEEIDKFLKNLKGKIFESDTIDSNEYPKKITLTTLIEEL